MAQRLVRKICPYCKEPYEPDPKQIHALAGDGLEGVEFAHGTGCKQCRGRGYLGRTAVFELLELTPEISELVVAGASANVVRDKAMELGFSTLRDNAIRKVRAGITTVEEALGVCTELM
jgi:type II secretory ATPase GspE/PulE/Tfp pilus assembly ATPase PilB-like protein